MRRAWLALLTEIGRPLARKISSNWAGYADDAPTPYPAVLLAPRATIWALEFVMAVKVSREMIIKLLNMCSSPKGWFFCETDTTIGKEQVDRE